ncbi:MAG: FHA domain-containing protein [Thermoanaerobaculales bacterium]|nr:FHA domain-containing protein [Thermoanaerobaculales bacterium]
MTDLYLEVVLGDKPSGRFEPVPGTSVIVGRAQDAGVTLVDPQLSGRHFEIFWRDGRPWIRDLGSTNGTQVNDVAVTEWALRHGDEISAGSHRFRVYFPVSEDAAVGGPPPLPSAPSPSPPPVGVSAPASAGSLPSPPPLHRQTPASSASPGPRRWLLVGAVAGALGLFAVGALAVMAVVLVGDSGRWDLLPAMARSALTNGWSGRLQPSPGLSTDTPALDIRPHPAVHLSAPVGALDTMRDFQVTELDEDQLRRHATTSPMGYMVPLAGVQLESDMDHRDLFPGALTVTLDLAELGVPKGMYDLVDIYHVDADGALRRQLIRRKGRRVAFDLRHNGPILVGALAVALGALFSKDEAQKWGGVGEWLGGKYWFYDYEIYRVWYPRSLGWRETPELLRVNAALEERWRAHRPRSQTGVLDGKGEPPPSGSGTLKIPEDRDERRTWIVGYFSDPQVQKLLRTLRDPVWVRANALPFQAGHVVTALERAHHYLFKHRKLRPPSGGSVDVILLKDWAKATGGGNEFGFSSDGCFSYPYIQLNRNKVPDGATPSPVYLDSLDTTILHELFHVVQKEYFNWSKYLNPAHTFGGARYTWFMEATALVLEEDAKEYYTTVKKWTRTHFDTTFDVTEHLGYFKLPLDAGGKTEKETQRKGYAASRFLLELQSRYYAGNPDAFLPAYLGAFCSFSNPAQALVSVTSSSSEVLGADYRIFSYRHARAIAANEPKPGRDVLSASHPIATWPLDPAPLSTPFWQVDFNSPSPERLKKALIVLRTHRLQQYGVYTRYSLDGGDFRTVNTPTGTQEIQAGATAGGKRSLMVQRVESYVDTPWSMGSIANYFGGKPKTTALLMLPPTKGPKLDLLSRTKKLRVTLDPSPLWRAGELKEFQVRIGPPTRKPFTFALTKGTSAEIPWSVVFYDLPNVQKLPNPILRALLNQQDLIDMYAVWIYLKTVIEPEELKLNACYREVLKYNSDDPPDAAGIEGPWSEVFEIPVNRDELAELNYGVGGTWSGTAMILHDPVQLKLNQYGSKIKGTCSYGGVVYRLEGTWRPEERGWEVELLVATNEGLASQLVTPYMRRMAGEELWLAWPACVLRRDPPRRQEDEETRGWLDRLLGW